MARETIEWKDGKIKIIDQTLLPETVRYLYIERLDDLIEAIMSLRIRGAPAIGIAAAMGVALSAFECKDNKGKKILESARRALKLIRKTRPTAKNLFWALARMEAVLNSLQNESAEKIQLNLLQEAQKILEEDRSICRAIGKNGARLLKQKSTVLTHCNAGGLATGEYGTALGVIYAARESGKEVKVYVDETRPLLQGSRLTAWELIESGIDVTVICDSAAGFLMKQKKVDCVIVGADRIALNGDTANKIGTYSLAVLAKENNIPFYVAAPVSTFDFTLVSGDEIPIEERSGSEITCSFGRKTAPENVGVYNPAFDITPGQLVSAFITEKGIFRSPYEETLKNLV